MDHLGGMIFYYITQMKWVQDNPELVEMRQQAGRIQRAISTVGNRLYALAKSINYPQFSLTMSGLGRFAEPNRTNTLSA